MYTTGCGLDVVRFLSECLGFLLSLYFHQYSLFIIRGMINVPIRNRRAINTVSTEHKRGKNTVFV
jgi:hypothetical protein